MPPILTRKNRKLQESARINGREANVLQQISTPDENGFIPILNLIANINEITMQTLINKEQLAFNQTILRLRLANVSAMNIQAITAQNQLLNILLAAINTLISDYNKDVKNANSDTISEIQLSTIASLNALNLNTLQPQLNTLYTSSILSFQNSTRASSINLVPSLATFATLLINNNVLDLNLLYQTLQNNINQTETECIDQLNILSNFIFDNETGLIVDETNSYLSTLRNIVSLIQTQINNNNNTLSVIR
jgi:hypothetical protein